MLRMIGRRIFQVLVSNGTDRVIWGMSIPAGSRIHDIRCRLNVVSNDETIFNKAVFSATEMYLLPVHDPDSTETLDALWDRLVEKDTDVATLDLDTHTADTSPFYEPGEINWEALLPVGRKPEKLWKSHKMYTIAEDAVFQYQDNQSPFTKRYVAGGVERIHVSRKLRVDQPMVLCLGMASPVTDDTTATVESILNEKEWPQVRYMKHVLERALLSALGLVEAGAETPWEEASVLLAKQLDPDVYENTSAAFASIDWNVFGEATVDYSVEGELGRILVTTGR